MLDRLKPLKNEDVFVIHQKTLEILRMSGMWFQSANARKIFKDNGFRVDGEIVFFNDKQIENALKTAPDRFTVLARNPKHNMEIGGEKYVFGPSGGSPYILDSNGAFRKSTSIDFLNSLKLTQVLDNISFNYELVASGDIPSEKALLFELLASIKLTDKPLNCDDPDGVELLSILFGVRVDKMQENARNGIVYALSCVNPLSPLGMSEHESDRLIKFCKSGVAVAISSMPMAGMTAPCTLPGLIICQNCEIIGSLVLTQLVNPGCPVLYGCIGTITNMKNMNAPIGTPETRIIEYSSAQMAGFYGLPTRGDAGLTDANDLDFQAGAESMFQFINSVRSGINFLPGLGALGSWNAASFEKLVLDAELAGYVKRFLRPMELSKETTAVELIKGVGPRGTFITEKHTFNHFRSEFYQPQIFSRESYANWEKDGKKEAKIRAGEKVLGILKDFEFPDLEKSLERDLDNYCADRLSGLLIKNIRNTV